MSSSLIPPPDPRQPSLSHIRAGKLRALAVTGAVRNHTLPDVPTIAESGLSGYECSLWQATPTVWLVDLSLVADVEGQKVRLSTNGAVAVTMEEEKS